MGNFYGNIKVDNGTRRIGVNDDGDYIELSLADVTLFDRFASVVEWFEKKQAELTAYDAVSYTHLDVYKIQGLRRCGHADRRTA